MMVPYLNLLKIKLIRDAFNLEYRGTGSLKEYAEDKYSKLKNIFPDIEDSKIIRIIISSIKDDELVETFASTIPSSYELFKKEAEIYDKSQFPFLYGGKEDESYDVNAYFDKYVKSKPNEKEKETEKTGTKQLSASLTNRLANSFFGRQNI